MPKSEPTFCPKWMVTMGDCMSLLLTFFVLLLTFSTIKEDQLMELIGVINGALNTVDDLRMASPLTTPEIESGEPANEITDSHGKFEARPVDRDRATPVSIRSLEIRQRFNRLQARVQSLGFNHLVSVHQLEDGIALRIELGQLFDKPGGELRPEALPALAAFADLAHNVANEVRVTTTATLSGGDAGLPAGYDWRQVLAASQSVADALIERYDLPEERIACGLAPPPANGPHCVELALIDNIEILQVSVKDIVRYNNRVW